MTILKMLVIAYLYRFSERQVEEATNLNLAIKEFVGLAVETGPGSQHLERIQQAPADGRRLAADAGGR